MGTVKTRLFASPVLEPLDPPDGSSLQERVNAFTTTLAAVNVLDVRFDQTCIGKFGASTKYGDGVWRYFAYVLYLE